MEKERWKEIPGFTDYFVSSFGKLRSFRERGGGRELCQAKNKYGYRFVNIRGDDGKQHVLFVHYLVCLAFVGERPPGKQVCHIDGNNQNNRASNLRYGTPRQNGMDKRVNNFSKCGAGYWRERTADKKQIKVLRDHLYSVAAGIVIGGGASQVDIANRLGISKYTLCRRVASLTKTK